MREIDRSRYSVAVVQRVTDLIDALTRRGPSTLADLADQIGCTRPTAFRVLCTLQASGHVIQDGRRGKWRLGPRIVSAGTAAATQRAQEVAALPLMRALATETGEAVYLHRRDGLDALTLAVVAADPRLRVYLALGDRSGLHAAHGRLLLAFAPERIQQQFTSVRLNRYTDRTPTDAAAVLADAARVRQRGWLISKGELAEGEITICVPVRDAAGAVLALATALPAIRMAQRRARDLLPGLLDCAARLTMLLGGSADPPAG